MASAAVHSASIPLIMPEQHDGRGGEEKEQGQGHGQSSQSNGATGNSSTTSTLDRLMRVLLPPSSFPSHIEGEAASTSTGHGHGHVHPSYYDVHEDNGENHPSTAIPPSKRNNVSTSSPSSPLSKTAARFRGLSLSPSTNTSSPSSSPSSRYHRHRHSKSATQAHSSSRPPQVDSKSPPDNNNNLSMPIITRKRSKTNVSLTSSSSITSHPPIVRAGSSHSSHYAGGIGESPTPPNRSRQNSTSSANSSTNFASSMFSHRQSASSGTQHDLMSSGGTGGALAAGQSNTLKTVASGRSSNLSPLHNSVGPSSGSSSSSNFPSIRGYTSFTNDSSVTPSTVVGARDASYTGTAASASRPRTPLLDPFMRYRQQQQQQPHPVASTSNNAGIGSGYFHGDRDVGGSHSLVSRDPPRIGLPSEDPAPESQSYVASLGLAPLITRPPQGGQPVYIPPIAASSGGQHAQFSSPPMNYGRTPDTMHAAPSSTYSTPAMQQGQGASPFINGTGAAALGQANSSIPQTAASSSAYLSASTANAGLGVGVGNLRPALRQRSSSVDSYLRRARAAELEDARDDSGTDHQDLQREHEHQHRSAFQSGSGSGQHSSNALCHTRTTSEDKSIWNLGIGLGRRKSSRDKSAHSRSRKGSLSNTVRTGDTAKLSSRFVRYGHHATAPSTPRRRRSSSFGGTAAASAAAALQGNEATAYPGRDSPTHPSIAASTQPFKDLQPSPSQQQSSGSHNASQSRGRNTRSRNMSRSNSGAGAGAGAGAGGTSSVDRRREEQHKRTKNKLVSARLPAHIHHRDARLPSQPLGYTWVCGARSAARTPSFYGDFDYSLYPGGKRKRSVSRSTITPRTYGGGSGTGGDTSANASAGARSGRQSEDLMYDSEPEYLARARARIASIPDKEKSRERLYLAGEVPTTSGNDGLLTSQQQKQQQQDAPLYPYSGGLLTTQEEKAIRRRSQSLVNLRNASGKGGAAHGLVISPPYREQSTEFIRTPRTAPVPFPDDQTDGAVPLLFMGTSAVVPDPKELQHSQGSGSTRSRTTSTGTKNRCAPSRASIEAIEDPDRRREALFATLPPPTRRSPIPKPTSPVKQQQQQQQQQQQSPDGVRGSRMVHVPDTSLASSLAASSAHAHGPGDYSLHHGNTTADYSQSSRPGDVSPPVDDYSQYEASQVIIGQSDLVSPATAQERFPVVYGRAFSTAPESHEGEILNTSSSQSDILLADGNVRDSLGSRGSLTPLTAAAAAAAEYGAQVAGGSGGSDERSVSLGSARVLDINEESFKDLFYKAPPPSKPLPSLPSPSTQSQSTGDSPSGSGQQSVASPPVPLSRGDSPEDLLTAARSVLSADNSSQDDRFPTPDFSVLQTFDLGDVASDPDRDSRRDTLTHPFARVATSHPNRSRPSLRATDDWNDVDESLLQAGDRQIWPESGVSPRDEDAEGETLLIPPPMARNFTNSTAATEDSFYTVTGGGGSNASTTALQAPSLEHQQSFTSARSHITATSAAETVHGAEDREIGAGEARGQFLDDSSDEEDDERDRMATIRRTALSPIYVARPNVPAYLDQQQHKQNADYHDNSGPASGPVTARASTGDNDEANRASFIDFEPVVPIRQAPASDAHSFIDDDSDDDDTPLTTSDSSVPSSARPTMKHDRPSVIIEKSEEEERDSTFGPMNPIPQLSPIDAGTFTSPSHYSLTPSEIVDSYRRFDSSGDMSRDSRGNFSLGVPRSPRSGDRSSGGSHAHSVSNVSVLSSFSQLGEFPEPPPSVTPAREKDEATAMMQHQPSSNTLNTAYPARRNSLPTGSANPSKATLGTQNTSVYTFSSSAHGDDEQDNTDRNDPDRGAPEPSTSQHRRPLFEFPMRKSSSRRGTIDSFLDTTTSPERGARRSDNIASLDSHIAFSSGQNSPAFGPPPERSASPSQQTFRLSGLFGKRPKHERTWSDPSAVSSSSILMARRDSGGFDTAEEKRQSWKGF